MKTSMALWGKQPPIIDAHVHTSFSSPTWKEVTDTNRVNFTQEGLLEAFERVNVEHAAIIHDELDQETPIHHADELMPELEEKALRVAIINPKHTTAKHLKKTEELVKNKKIRALKIYTGRYPIYCHDKRFSPFYKMAGKHEIPVYLHTGDTMGPGAKLKYAHPLEADETATDFPDTNFILTQLGNPWFVESAEVAYKNDNIFLETGGLFVGMLYDPLMQARIKYVIDVLENPRKIVYGSDWPITHMHTYFNIMKKIFPEGMHERIFYKNARDLFNL